MLERSGATVYDDFARPDGWPGDIWYKHRMPDYDMWDPAVVVACPGAPTRELMLEARRFTLARRDFHDHVKALMYSTADFTPGPGGLVSIATQMSVTTPGTGANPFGADPRDVRLACGAFNTIDLRTAVVFDFFASNSRIVALYERLPLAATDDDGYPLFTELTPTAVTTAPGQWHDYEIAYDQKNDRAEWCVDGAVVAEREAIGAPPGERAPVVKLGAVKIGGGLFTLLDDLHNDRRRTGDGAKSAGLDPSYGSTLFGQGARVAFRAFRVTQA
jgi:hypothetical protein